MKLFVCLHNQLGAISRLRYLSESASHLLSLLVSESIFRLPFFFTEGSGVKCSPKYLGLPLRSQPQPAGEQGGKCRDHKDKVTSVLQPSLLSLSPSLSLGAWWMTGVKKKLQASSCRIFSLVQGVTTCKTKLQRTGIEKPPSLALSAASTIACSELL